MKTLRRLGPYFKPYRAVLALAMFFGLLLSGIALGQARLIKYIFDDGLTDKNMTALTYAPLMIVALYVFNGIFRFFHMYWLRYFGEKIAFDVRRDLQAHYAQLSLDYHTGHSPGSLLSRNINDVTAVQQGVSLLADVIREPITAIVMIAYLFYSDWKLTLLVFIAAPILILTSRSLGRSVRKYSHIQQEIWENVTLVLKETLDGIRVVKAFSLEPHMKEKFQNVIRQMMQIRRTILRREEIAGPVFELLGAITVAGIIYYVGVQALAGKMTAGSFASYIAILASLQNPIKKLQDAHVRLQHTIAASQRIFEVLDTPLTVKDPEDNGQLAMPWNDNWTEIEFRDVRFQYGAKEVLKGVNLKVQRGEVVAIVGSSGGGKTTLVNLLPRFYDVTSGQILIEGEDIRHFRIDTLRSHIGLVTQDVFLFNETIRENILAGKTETTQGRLDEALEISNARFVKNLKERENARVGDRGSLLSGGERQRISIARAVYKNTPILILDEATSSLDSESEKLVQEALEKLMVGRTTFVIAHRLSTIQKADRIVVLSDGRVIEQGRHEDLLKAQGVYFNFYRHQFSTPV